MTTEHNGGPPGPPPGHYLATDGQYYPIPVGQALAADGQLYPIAPAGDAPSPSATTAWTWDKQSGLVVFGAALAFFGAFLPWASVGPFTASGTDGDGKLTLLLAVASGALGAAGISKSKKGMLIGSLVCAVLTLAIGAYDMADIGSVAEGPFGMEVQIGAGLYLTVIGALGGVVGAAMAISNRSRQGVRQ